MKKWVLFTAVLLLAPGLRAAERIDEKGVSATGVTVTRERDAVEVAFELQPGRNAIRNDQVLIITPVLRQGDRRMELLPVVVKGRRARISAAARRQAERQRPGPKPLYTKNGKTVAYHYTFPYEAWMPGSELIFEGADVTSRTSTALEWGVVAVNLLAREQEQLLRAEPPVVVVVPPPEPEEPSPVRPSVESTGDKWAREFSFVVPVEEFQQARQTPDGGMFDYDMPLDLGRGLSSRQQADVVRFVNGIRDGALTIRFGQGRRTIDRELADNNRVLVDLITAVRSIDGSADSRVARVVIAGFASPEGQFEENERLAWERAVAVRNFFVDNSPIDPALVHTYNGSVDWEGLRKLVAGSDMPHRDAVLRIIEDTPVWDAVRNTGRHGELMRLAGGEPYNYMLRRFFPQLRQAAYIKVYYENNDR